VVKWLLAPVLLVAIIVLAPIAMLALLFEAFVGGKNLAQWWHQGTKL
jgi:hypothetical protein